MSPGVNRNVVFSRRESSPPNGDGFIDGNSPCGRGPGQSSGPTTPLAGAHFTFYHLNLRGLSEANSAVFHALLETLEYPTYVAVTETWLDKSVEARQLSGYRLVSRLDRRRGRPDRGGIALYAREGHELTIVHVGDSDMDERSWHIIHSDVGPISACVWYRRPDTGEIGSIHRFEQELQRFSQDCVATMVVGDMNVHNPEWLRWSNGSTREGTELEGVCAANGLSQQVQGPTRGNHLLDLVLTDFGSGIRTTITPGIHDNDHRGTLTKVNVSVPSSEPVSRKVYDYKKANWKRLSRQLKAVDWREFFHDIDAGVAAERLTAKILETVEDCIPSKWIVDRTYAHPWLDDACREALRCKHAAVGTPNFEARRDECTQVFRDTHKAYVTKVRADLKTMSPSSRGWWKLSGSLLTKATGQENIPPLKRADGSWAKSSEEKAAELSRTFQQKSVLPTIEENEYTELGPPCTAQMPSFLRLRTRTVKKILRELDEFSGTGPDLLPARILRKCAAELTLPVTLLTRLLLREGCWPDCWRTHWVQSIHKRASKAEAKNYRGVHLTPQLSKVVERAVASLLVPWLESQGSFGPHQYAYSKGKGYKDVLTINVCSWILALERGELLGIYCSDVSGAFDRVPHCRLGDKLERQGLHPGMLSFLRSWLQDRVQEVVVGGRSAGAEALRDSVFQGTVLGPPLWNVFYSDARQSVDCLGFFETVFADDFNCWKGFAKCKVPANLRAQVAMRGAQKELHAWGRANQVLFDPSKESFHLLHRTFHEGGDFKILGVLFDDQLLMHTACRTVATEAGWRLKQLLRCRRFFSTPEMVHLYKAQVLSYIESSTPGVYHAAPSVLDRIDRVQRRFLREIGMDERTALRDYRLAPLPARRDMAMLGALHRVALGLAPPQLAALFPLRGTVTEPWHMGRHRNWRPLHNRQLTSLAPFRCTEVMSRSLFGVVPCYNKLPQNVVALQTVKSFQRNLQNALKLYERQTPGDDWGALYSAGWKRLTRLQLDTFFA